jgi:putative transcriptional regulator
MTKRDIGQELLDSVRAIKRGEGRRVTVSVPQDVRAVREGMNLSQSAFAAILGVSTRTLQDWEQGRRHPSGAARSLLLVATKRPDVLKQVFRDIEKAA